MQEETNHVYELAKKEEKELKEKLMEEFKSIGKPEMWNDVQQYTDNMGEAKRVIAWRTA